MHKTKNSLAALAAIAVLALAVGCASFESNSGKTIAGITGTVDQARKAWVNYVTDQRALQPDPAQRQALEQQVAKVGVVYAQYQQAMRTANAALTAYHNSPADQSKVNTAIAAVSAASGDLVALINSIINAK